MIGEEVVKAALEFENAMNRLVVQTGAGPEHVDRLKEAVLALSALGGLSPVQAADHLSSVLAEGPDPLYEPDPEPPLVPYRAGDDTRVRKGFPRVSVDEAHIEDQAAFRLSTTRNGEAVEQWTPMVPRFR